MWPLLPENSFDEFVKVALVTAGVTMLVVLLHYEGLKWLARFYGPRTSGTPLSRGAHRQRSGFVGLVFALLALHVVEIWCYGTAFYWLEHQPDMGYIHGEHGIKSMFDAVYFSATIYTTLGLGDLSPVGTVRLLAGMESLTGLLLITWSASFTYLEMSRVWACDDSE